MHWPLLAVPVLLAVSLVPFAAPPQDPAPAPPPPPEQAIASLGWLAGEWRGKAGDAEVVSWHSDPRGGAIAMATKELTGGKLSLFDFGIVLAKDGTVGFTPFPFGKASRTFRLTNFDPKKERALFANEQHDFPKRFLFERTAPDTLRITLTGDERGKPTRVEYELKLAAAK